MTISPHPHRRMNILTGEWILISPHRLKRPWQGKTDPVSRTKLPVYDEKCYLCPGNRRAGGEQNPQYKNTFVFANDYAALYREIDKPAAEDNGLLIYSSERGLCRVICYSPDHSLSFAFMNKTTLLDVIHVWTEEYQSLGRTENISYVQIFENRGRQMGCSNPHPHGQIWANETIPDIPARETARQADYLHKKQSCLLCDYLTLELELQERIILQDDHFVVLIPFWAVWPYEVMILPRAHRGALPDLCPEEQRSLAALLKRLCTRYDNLFEVDFPYSMGIHQQPVDAKKYPGWHFHFHFYPPLLRSASVSKFMVGYEMMAAPQRDITAEYSARRLRELDDIHYSLKQKDTD